MKFVASLTSSLNGASRLTAFSHGRYGGELTRPPLAALTSNEKGNCNASQPSPRARAPRRAALGRPAWPRTLRAGAALARFLLQTLASARGGRRPTGSRIAYRAG